MGRGAFLNETRAMRAAFQKVDRTRSRICGAPTKTGPPRGTTQDQTSSNSPFAEGLDGLVGERPRTGACRDVMRVHARGGTVKAAARDW